MAKKTAFHGLAAEDRAAFVERVRELLDSLGTQTRAAGIADVSLPQIGAYRSGESAPSFIPMARLAAASGYSLHWIYSGRGPKKVPTDALLVPWSEPVRDALSAQQQLQASDRDAARIKRLTIKGAAREEAAQFETRDAPMFLIRELISGPLLSIYDNAGVPLQPDESVELIGDAIDHVFKVAQNPRQWFELSEWTVKCHEEALKRATAPRAPKRKTRETP